MKTNRRKFVQIAGVVGTDVLSGGFSSCSLQKPAGGESVLTAIKEAVNKSHPQQFNMSGYAAPKLETVRIGFVGLVHRGIAALCDKVTERNKAAQNILEKHRFPEAKEYSGSEEVWKELCENPEIDLVYICNPWNMHTTMSVYAMENGKHAATEDPAASTCTTRWGIQKARRFFR